MDELITFIRNTFTEKFNAEVTDIRSEFNESEITVTRYFKYFFILLIYIMFQFIIFYFMYMI